MIGIELAQRATALALAETLRDTWPDFRTVCDCGSVSVKAQMKRADRSGAAVAVIIGADELAADEVTLKPLRGQGEQQRVPRQQMLHALAAVVK